jgi:hypothetical protein
MALRPDIGSPAVLGPSGSHPWLLGGSEDPWHCVPDFRQVCLCRMYLRFIHLRRIGVNSEKYLNWTWSEFNQENRDLRLVYGLPQSSGQILRSELRRVCIFGLCLETLSPGPLCIRTRVPLWVSGLQGLKAVKVLPEQISLSDTRFLFAGRSKQPSPVALVLHSCWRARRRLGAVPLAR